MNSESVNGREIAQCQVILWSFGEDVDRGKLWPLSQAPLFISETPRDVHAVVSRTVKASIAVE
ncbi:hypothetical protein BaRGS_00032443, partial [Batillaria attramentaria]